MDYIVKANVLLIIFILCYKLFLQNDTFYQANRFFLFFGLVLSLTTPFIIIPIDVEMIANSNGIDFAAFNTLSQETESVSKAFSFFTILKWSYSAGVLFFLIQFLIELVSVFKIIKTHNTLKEERFTFIKTDNNYTAFSFFKYIVYNPNHFKNQELTSILLHEKIHAKHCHSIDVLFVKLISIFFWFNPMVWVYKKLLHQNLEFIADDITASQIENTSSYQNLLLKTFLSNPQLTVVNTFYNSSIKKRIIMLQKSKSNPVSAFKFAIVLPFLALFLMSFNTEDVYVLSKTDQTTKLLSDQKEFLVTPNTSDDELSIIEDYFKPTERILKFKTVKRNTNNEITHLILASRSPSNKTLIDHLNMSDDASKEPIKSFKLALSNDGKGIKFASLLPGGIEELIITEKVTVTKFSPNNEKQETSSTEKKEKKEIITYYLENKGDDLKLDSKKEENTNYTFKINTAKHLSKKSKVKITETGETPLYIIDDKEETKEKADHLNAELIDSINILKGKQALTKYGDKGINGVVIITTKTYANKKNASVFITSSKTEITPKDIKAPLLIFINDKESSQEQLDAINPNSIESVNVLKKEKALSLYGKKGKNGAIIVKTK
ncbi:hypothetical protein ES677_03055 [Bizionia gelidisalsuginis]|uniref:Peptidase M56 domain-containing protein n=1 Tax=Bizionia gelidisalsuginis TaxID=291188 RepID=A0ABY3MDU5_9FLAO|nr:M56 family metallopeptidase [Bizionia gelidisalsuginis]TYC17171.1 hypothetical protein ES677_03055 [Bizionia gelidisalsuginis]